MNGSYTDMFMDEANRIYRKLMRRPKVIHRATCSYCGRNLVNIYYSESKEIYKCKRCLDKEANRNELLDIK